MNILVITEKKSIANSIKYRLRKNGYQVSAVTDGAKGLKLALSREFGLVVIGWKLPKKDGLTFTRELRQSGGQVPIIMLMPQSTVEDMVSSLEAGADAYLTIPLLFDELLARIRALLRRSRWKRGTDIEFADLRLDTVSHKVWRKGHLIDLSDREYTLLLYLMRNPETLLTRAMICRHVWGYPTERYSNVMDVYISYLRRKIDNNYSPKLIHTIHRHGYILAVKDSQPTSAVP